MVPSQRLADCRVVNRVEWLRGSEILATERFHTIVELLDKGEADSEDLFAPVKEQSESLKFTTNGRQASTQARSGAILELSHWCHRRGTGECDLPPLI